MRALALLPFALLCHCDHQLTVQDAQLGLKVACESLATVLRAEHPESTPEAWRLALQACNVERTTQLIDTLLSATSGVEPQTFDLAPSPFAPPIADGGSPPFAPEKAFP